jgi:hypothetical protein
MQASSTLDLILRIVKKGDGSTQAQKEIKALKNEVKEMAAGAAAGLAALAVAYKVTVGATLDYASTVRDLSRNIGVNVEETSRLIQVADDYKISSDEISNAMEMAVKRGFKPSIESIADLADQYKSIQDPVERASVLSAKFGKNWTTLTPLLEAGGDAIRSQSAAISPNLILTQKQIDQAREHEILLDNLTDTVQGYAMALGNFAIPVLNKAIVAGQDYVKVYQALWIKAQQMTGAISDEEAAMQAEILATGELHTVFDDMYDTRAEAIGQSREHATVILDEKEAIKENADAVSRLGDLMAGAVGKEMGAYGDKIVDLKDKQADLLAEIKKYEDQQGKTITITDEATVSESELALAGIRAEDAAIRLTQAQKDLSENTDPDKQRDMETAMLEAKIAADGAAEKVENLGGKMGGSRDVTLDYTGKLTDLHGQLADVNVALGESAAAHEDQTRRILFGILQQQLAVDGFTTDELLALNTVAEKWGLVDSQTAEATEGIIASVAKAHETGNWEALYGDLDEVDRRLRGLPTRIDIEVHTNYTSSGAAGEVGIGPTAPLPAGPADEVPVSGAFQHGTQGWLTVPPGFPNDSFRMGLSSGERFNVVPNTFNNSFNVGAPGVDVRALAREIAGLLGAQADARRRTGG